ncbi:MAG: acyloxyacyl hydrolase [Verrucomicrobiae bacterium]|nr:acyloxyacyl hydrolase [Verrucomicrobiae bacterium]
MRENSAKNRYHLWWCSLGSAVTLAAVCGTAPLQAGDPPALCDATRSGLCDATKPAPAPKLVKEPEPSQWTMEVGSGVLFSNVREFHSDGYTLVPAFIMASLKLDEPSEDEGWWRGYSEFAFRAYGMAVTDGPESRILGMNFGPRYNFTRPGWKIVPFIGGTVGFGFADSRHRYFRDGSQWGLAQDSNFQFGANVGLRFDISERAFIRLMGEYIHMSSLGLCDSDRDDRPIDAMGPHLSFGWRF